MVELTIEQEEKIEAISIFFGMQKEVSPRTVRDYCLMICKTNLRSLGISEFINNDERRALAIAFHGDCHNAYYELAALLKEAGCMPQETHGWW